MRLRRKGGGRGEGGSNEMILQSKRLAASVLTAPRQAPGFQTTPNYCDRQGKHGNRRYCSIQDDHRSAIQMSFHVALQRVAHNLLIIIYSRARHTTS